MAITYTYEINELKEIPTLGGLDRVITEVAYTYKGTNEEGIESPYPGRTTLPTPNKKSFTDVSKLTPEIVISWLEANADLDTMKRAIEQHIEQQSGVILKGNTLPWAPTVEEVIEPAI